MVRPIMLRWLITGHWKHGTQICRNNHKIWACGRWWTMPVSIDLTFRTIQTNIKQAEPDWNKTYHRLLIYTIQTNMHSAVIFICIQQQLINYLLRIAISFWMRFYLLLPLLDICNRLRLICTWLHKMISAP